MGNENKALLRTSEFLWQEGHTAHATAEEAEKEALDILELYRKLAEDFLAIPVFTGIKSDSEKFAGADKTYCIEAMMKDKKALQAGTSHNLGQNFAKAFNVKFQNKDNKEELVWATSWGISTRLIGAVILTHGDSKGLRLPPKIAPIQLVVVPIFRNKTQKEEIKLFLKPIILKFENLGIRIKQDWTDSSPGYKFNEWELKGVPLRAEVGPRDVEKKSIVLVRRDTGEKISTLEINIESSTKSLLIDIQKNLFKQAKEFRDKNTHDAFDYRQLKKIIDEGGFVRCGWDGSIDTEMKIKEETKATIRCILKNQNPLNLSCVYSGKPAKFKVIFAKAY